MLPLTLAPKWRRLPGFAHQLRQPPLIGHVAVAPGALARANTCDAWLAEYLGVPAVALRSPRALVERFAFWVGELQRQARVAVAEGCWVSEPRPSDVALGGRGPLVFELALPMRHAQACATVLREVCRAANTLLGATPPDDAARAAVNQRLTQLAQALRPLAEPGLNQFHLLRAAQQLDWPVHTIGQRIWRVGTGARMRLVQSSRNDATGVIGLEIAQRKWLTSEVLRELGLPVPPHIRVKDVAGALAAAQRLGWPVVVKPGDLDQGKGVAADLRDAEQVSTAFVAAQALSADVLVERHVAGDGYRLTVVDGTLMAAFRRRAGGVTGDGVHDIHTLLLQQLARPEVRGARNLGRVSLDDEALALLADQGLAPASIAAAGRFVRLRRRDNVSAGGTLEHLPLDLVHADNRRLAERAARALFLDVAGVDLLSTDIGRPWHENGAVICEVNATPQVGAGLDRQNHLRLLQRLFPHGARVPVHLMLCGNATEATLPAQLRTLRSRLGLLASACRAHVELGDETLATALASGQAAARVALFERRCTSLLFALTPGELLAGGLPLDRVDAVHVSATAAWPAAERQGLASALQWCAAPVHRDASSP